MVDALELSGQTFGYWSVLERSGVNKKGRSLWICRCKCGKIQKVVGSILKKGLSTGCRTCSTLVDIIGQRYGKLTVMERAGTDNYRQATWLCSCDCGGTKVVKGANLRKGVVLSCGCLRKRQADRAVSVPRKYTTKDMTGQRFGRLVAVSRVPEQYPDHLVRWNCQCDCGGSKIVAGRNLRRGHTASCGCLVREGKQELQKKLVKLNSSRAREAFVNGAELNMSNWGAAVLRIKGNVCEDCGWSGGRCHAHHIVPCAQGGKNTFLNSRVLCPNCHSQMHKKKSA